MLNLYRKTRAVWTKAQRLHSESEQIQPLPCAPQLQHQIKWRWLGCTLKLSWLNYWGPQNLPEPPPNPESALEARPQIGVIPFSSMSTTGPPCLKVIFLLLSRGLFQRVWQSVRPALPRAHISQHFKLSHLFRLDFQLSPAWAERETTGVESWEDTSGHVILPFDLQLGYQGPEKRCHAAPITPILSMKFS